jgi:Leucine-rich repeat (LRR) protein
MKTKPALLFIAVTTFININTIRAQAVNVQDSLALIDLYDSTDGPGWYHHDNWLTGPVSTWYGITVFNARVTGIHLGGNFLEGGVPTSIGDLTKLDTLDLYGNDLGGGIPSSVGNLADLQYLNFSFNYYFGGNIPHELSKLLKLQYLDLYDCQLSGVIPSFLGDLLNLRHLNLGANNLNGKIPKELGNLLNLSELILKYNNLSGSIPPALGNLTALVLLNLSNNQLSGKIPSELGNLANLTELDISVNPLGGSIPKELGNLKNLTRLELGFDQLSGTIPSFLGNMVNLQLLALYGNQLSGSIPPELGNLKNLSYLQLMWNQLSGSIPPELGNLKNISDLDLGGNQLSGTIPRELGNLDAITFVGLSDNRFTFDGMEFIVKNFTYPSYAPQANIHLHQSDSSLSVYAGGTLSNNTYKWFMVGKTSSLTIKGDSVFRPADHGRYYAQVTNSICIDLTLYTDTVEYLGVLPVTVINLEAYRQGKQNKIEWTSVTEINIDKYEIQRASNAMNFITIGYTKAKSNGTQKTAYSFIDAKPLLGNNYYRLKIFDNDGKITYSNIVLVNMNNDNINTRVSPVPANQILHVETNSNTSFSMIDRSGKILFTVNINGKGAIDVSHLSAEIYFLKNNSTGNVQKVVIAR